MAKNTYKKEISEIKMWLNDGFVQKHILKENEDDILSRIRRKPDQDLLWIIACRLHLISGRHACLALIDSENANSMYSCHLASYVGYEWIYLRLAIHEIETGKNGGNIIWTSITLIFYLILGFARFSDADWLGSKIYFSVKNHLENSIAHELREISEADLDQPITSAEDPRNLNTPGIHAYSESPLCGMSLRLWSIISKKRDPRDALPSQWPQCGIYEGLFTNWDDPNEIVSCINKACDFHIERMNPDRRIHHDIPEFETTPFRQIPFEILAYRNVRRKMGLETPFPAHPLLDTPFVKNLPDELPPSDDPLLNEVIAAVRKVLPDV